jgi:hypothetical protein
MLIGWFNILGEAVAIICLANLVTTVTSISMSAVCTNGQIKAGKVFVKFIYDCKNLLCYNKKVSSTITGLEWSREFQCVMSPTEENWVDLHGLGRDT